MSKSTEAYKQAMKDIRKELKAQGKSFITFSIANFAALEELQDVVLY
jgi:hypothetical protein